MASTNVITHDKHRNISPEFIRRGFVPVEPANSAHVRDMARPKGMDPEAKLSLPAVGAAELSWAVGALKPDERKALDFIAEHADLIPVEHGEPFLLVPTTPDLLDILATVGAEADDRENDLEDERDEGEEDDRSSDYAVESGGPRYDSLHCAPYDDDWEAELGWSVSWFA